MSSDLESFAANLSTPAFVNQYMLNDLDRDLALLEYAAEILGSNLKHGNLLKEGTKISEFRFRNEKLASFFDLYNGLCFSNDVNGLMMKLDHEHKCDD